METKKSKGKAIKEGWPCICNGCKKSYTYGDENSPVVYPRVWRTVLTYWGISEEEEHRRQTEYVRLYKSWKTEEDQDKKEKLFEEMRKPEYHTFFCTECMEKALGRKLERADADYKIPYNKVFFEKFGEKAE